MILNFLRNIKKSLVGLLKFRTSKISIDPKMSIEQQRVLPWIRDNGDRTHRLQYDLSEKDIVIDLGGYEGQWASDIFSMYCCQIYIFEPVPEYAKNIQKRFQKNKHMKIYQFGLASDNINTKISVTGDSSSSYKPNENMIDIQLVKASDFLEENRIYFINLLKINIEGGEYDLLEHMISTNLISKVQNIQIQFHDFFPDAKDRMKELQNQLAHTHKLTYQYEFVWENWVLR